MLVIVCCLLLLLFWVKASRINPGKYPHAQPDIVAAWQSLLLSYCRRFTGLLLIWIILAIANGALLSQALENGSSVWHGIYYTSLIITSLFLLASLVYITLSVVSMRRWAKAQQILPKPKV